MDGTWQIIRQRLAAMLSSLERLQQEAEVKLAAGEITLIEFGRLVDLSAKILNIAPRVKKSIDEADIAATEENVGALVQAALIYLEESGAV